MTPRLTPAPLSAPHRGAVHANLGEKDAIMDTNKHETRITVIARTPGPTDHWPPAEPGAPLGTTPEGERRVGDDGETRCGDWLRAGARRLCGDCPGDGDGCGEVLERHDT